MGLGAGAAREDGQIVPGLVMLMLAILALAVMGFQIGKAAILRSQAQTAADAAALAGAREIKRQLQVQWATFGTTDVTAIDQALVEAQMRDYADRNGGRVERVDVNGADVRVWVDTEEELGEGRPPDRLRARPWRRPGTRHAVALGVDGRRHRRRGAAGGRGRRDAAHHRQGVGGGRAQDRQAAALLPRRRDHAGAVPEVARVLRVAEQPPGARRRRRARLQPRELAPQVRRHGRDRRELRHRRRGRRARRDPRPGREARLLHDLARQGPLRPHAHRPVARRRRAARAASPARSTT